SSSPIRPDMRSTRETWPPARRRPTRRSSSWTRGSACCRRPAGTRPSPRCSGSAGWRWPGTRWTSPASTRGRSSASPTRGARSRVRAIDTFEGPVSRAHAPMSVVVRLADEVDAGRGDLLAHPDSAPAVGRHLEAMAVWLAERPLDLARAYAIKHAACTSPARIEAVRSRFDPETGARGPAFSLGLNEIGMLAVRTARPVAADNYADNRATGAFILIDALTNETVAAGMIASRPEADPGRAAASPIERR